MYAVLASSSRTKKHYNLAASSGVEWRSPALSLPYPMLRSLAVIMNVSGSRTTLESAKFALHHYTQYRAERSVIVTRRDIGCQTQQKIKG